MQPDIRGQIKEALTTYVKGGSAQEFALAIHKINDQCNAYNAGMIPSCMDTGTPKCNTAPGQGLAVGGINTNYFVANEYHNISQSKASAVQAHSGKIASRLDKLQTITEERLARYKRNYTQLNPAKLAQAVIGDYVTGSWRWGSHFKQTGRDFLQNTNNNFLNKNELTNEDKKDLLNAIRDLQTQIQMSSDFGKTSSFNTRLIFLESKINEPYIEPTL